MLSKFSITPFSAPRKFTLLFLLFFTSGFALKAQQPANKVTVKSGFTAKLINLEAAASETFRYNTTLSNVSSTAHVYELEANLPLGWMIAYKVEGSQVTSINVDAGKMQDISIEINAANGVAPKKYTIPVKAISGADTLSLNLEAVVKGSYSMTLTTPTGRLSDDVTSGSQQELQLVITNSGTLPLNNLQLSSQLPTNWEATFEPSNIKQLDPGKTINVTATLKVPDKTIAGDYAATFTATNSNTNAQAAFRLMVKTSLLSGWIGIMVILLAIGIVYYLIRKYGRR